MNSKISFFFKSNIIKIFYIFLILGLLTANKLFLSKLYGVPSILLLLLLILIIFSNLNYDYYIRNQNKFWILIIFIGVKYQLNFTLMPVYKICIEFFIFMINIKKVDYTYNNKFIFDNLIIIFINNLKIILQALCFYLIIELIAKSYFAYLGRIKLDESELINNLISQVGINFEYFKTPFITNEYNNGFENLIIINYLMIFNCFSIFIISFVFPNKKEIYKLSLSLKIKKNIVYLFRNIIFVNLYIYSSLIILNFTIYKLKEKTSLENLYVLDILLLKEIAGLILLIYIYSIYINKRNQNKINKILPKTALFLIIYMFLMKISKSFNVNNEYLEYSLLSCLSFIFIFIFKYIIKDMIKLHKNNIIFIFVVELYFFIFLIYFNEIKVFKNYILFICFFNIILIKSNIEIIKKEVNNHYLLKKIINKIPIKR